MKECEAPLDLIKSGLALNNGKRAAKTKKPIVKQSRKHKSFRRRNVIACAVNHKQLNKIMILAKELASIGNTCNSFCNQQNGFQCSCRTYRKEIRSERALVGLDWPARPDLEQNLRRWRTQSSCLSIEGWNRDWPLRIPHNYLDFKYEYTKGLHREQTATFGALVASSALVGSL